MSYVAQPQLCPDPLCGCSLPHFSMASGALGQDGLCGTSPEPSMRALWEHTRGWASCWGLLDPCGWTYPGRARVRRCSGRLGDHACFPTIDLREGNESPRASVSPSFYSADLRGGLPRGQARGCRDEPRMPRLPRALAADPSLPRPPLVTARFPRRSIIGGHVPRGPGESGSPAR